MKFIIISGGIISGIGKGIVTSSIGALLKGCNVNVCAIKIDPYWNVDAGLMSPGEHGEVFVLDDGGEVDLDLGNYERYLDATMTKMNNMTSGKIAQKIMDKERAGDFLGRTVRTVPDFSDFIKNWIRDTAIKANADICLIELGGTIGDIEASFFIEALRSLKYEEERKNVVNVQVDPIFQNINTPEMKTKPVQAAIRNSRQYGLDPEILICSSTRSMSDELIETVFRNTGIPKNNIINVIPYKSVYQSPCYLYGAGILREIGKLLEIDLQVSNDCLNKWKRISDIAINATETINIALVGKYVGKTDPYTSILKALEHACYSINTKPQVHLIDSSKLEGDFDNDSWTILKSCSCLIVPGGFDQRGTEGMIAAIKWARENKIPYLGICLGFQLAVVEHARNVIGLKDANSEEFSPEGHPVIIEMLEYLDPERKLGGTMRLGLKTAKFTKPSILHELYGTDIISERHRHRYEVNPDYVSRLNSSGFNFVAQNDDGCRMEILELEAEKHPYFVGVQYHPEFRSRPFRPSPPFIGFVNAAKKYQDAC